MATVYDAATHEMGVYHESVEQVPEGLPLPRWSWDGPPLRP